MNKYLGNLISYVAENNPKGVNRIAYKHGYIPPVSKQGREGFMIRGIAEEGDDFLRDIARIHPDRELVMNADGSTIGGEATDANKEVNVINVSPARITDSNTVNVIILVVFGFIIYKALS